MTRHLTVDPAERQLGGTVGGTLWLLGGLTLVLFPLLSVSHGHVGLVLTLGLLGAAWGASCIWVLKWRSMYGIVTHISAFGGIVAVAVAVWATGGSSSPAWLYLTWVGLFGCYFYERPSAIFYLGLCILAQMAPLVYEPDSINHAHFISALVIAATGGVTIGGALIAGKERLARLRERAESLAAEQSALRRIATAVVRGETSDRIYEIAAAELAARFGADVAGVIAVDEGGESGRMVGSWSAEGFGSVATGTPAYMRAGGVLREVLRTGRAVRDAELPSDSVMRALGCRSGLGAPILVDGANWGIVVLGAGQPDRFERDEQHLTGFCKLLANAVENLADRERLSKEALTDPLTGLANHRMLHARLGDSVHEAARRGEPLAVVVLDIDHFKQINDIGGHDLGDETLVAVARCLRRLGGPDHLLSRSGGDEFTWVLPGLSATQALERVEAARTLVSAVSSSYRVTLSAGICDTGRASEPGELIRLADGALYWSKAHGRDRSQVYDPQVVDTLSADERADRLERSQALVGLLALARAIDAKDPATHAHSERVAELAGHLALAAGWSEGRAALLREAALVHDVGKIGISDTILRKPGRLSEEERRQVNEHAELSARIVEGVLTAEQVSWIRTHHERPDGRGYPRGLCGDEIPEGGGLLALADAFDVMTVGRAYSQAREPVDALAECRALAGAHFDPAAVEALETLLTGGSVPWPLPVPGRPWPWTPGAMPATARTA